MTSPGVFVWHENIRRSAVEQMAIDRGLADLAVRDNIVACRLYQWSADSMSFGANEAATRTWDRERLERLEVPSVRRPTGGRGVWHDARDLTYSVTSPLTHFGDLRTAYRVIHEQLARAFRSLDLDATVAPPTRRPTLDPGACFELTVGGEVLVAGRKTVGSAQALLGKGLLQHGAIARSDHAAKLARFRLKPVTNDQTPVVRDFPEATELATAIERLWAAEIGANPLPDAVFAAALAEGEKYAEHFGDPVWTWRR